MVIEMIQINLILGRFLNHCIPIEAAEDNDEASKKLMKCNLSNVRGMASTDLKIEWKSNIGKLAQRTFQSFINRS